MVLPARLNRWSSSIFHFALFFRGLTSSSKLSRANALCSCGVWKPHCLSNEFYWWINKQAQLCQELDSAYQIWVWSVQKNSIRKALYKIKHLVAWNRFGLDYNGMGSIKCQRYLQQSSASLCVRFCRDVNPQILSYCVPLKWAHIMWCRLSVEGDLAVYHFRTVNFKMFCNMVATNNQAKVKTSNLPFADYHDVL